MTNEQEKFHYFQLIILGIYTLYSVGTPVLFLSKYKCKCMTGQSGGSTGGAS